VLTFLGVIGALIALVMLGLLFGGPSEEERQRQAQAQRENTARSWARIHDSIKSDGPKASAAVVRHALQDDPQGRAVARCLQVAHESLQIIRGTKNSETLLSRLFVARRAVNDAASQSALSVPEDSVAALIAELDAAASSRLADLYCIRVGAMLEKSAAAKTDKTREKHALAAAELVRDGSHHPNVLPADRKRIKAAGK